MVEGTEGKIQQRIECGKDGRPDMALMDRNQIMEIIPHRDPFLLIDEIESMDEENGTITAIKYVRESEYYFEGHFPQKKVMPGVLIVEALAQSRCRSDSRSRRHNSGVNWLFSAESKTPNSAVR